MDRCDRLHPMRVPRRPYIQKFKLDISDADYVKGIECTLIAMGKLIKEGWKFTFELSELVKWTPSGHKISCTLGDNNVTRIPHGVRTGEGSA